MPPSARRTFQMAEEQADKVAETLWFLDLKFSRFFTPKLVGPLWATYLCLIVILFLGSIVYDLRNLPMLFVPFAIIVDFIALVFALIGGRVVLEAVLKIFRVADRLESPKKADNP